MKNINLVEAAQLNTSYIRLIIRLLVIWECKSHLADNQFNMI